MKAFKVFRVQDNRLVSCNPYLPTEFQFKYARKGANKARRNSRFFVFETEEAARNFIDEHRSSWNHTQGYSTYQLHEVEVSGVAEITSVVPVWRADFAKLFLALWRHGDTDALDGNAPDGTLGAKTLKIGKLIETFK